MENVFLLKSKLGEHLCDNFLPCLRSLVRRFWWAKVSPNTCNLRATCKNNELAMSPWSFNEFRLHNPRNPPWNHRNYLRLLALRNITKQWTRKRRHKLTSQHRVGGLRRQHFPMTLSSTKQPSMPAGSPSMFPRDMSSSSLQSRDSVHEKSRGFKSRLKLRS